MVLWSFYPNILFLVYFISVPAIIFLVKKDAPAWLKSGRLLFLMLLLPALITLINYVRIQTVETSNGYGRDCWIYNLYFFLLAAGISAVYTGWWECAWRLLHKQFFWSVKKNFDYGVTSTIIILSSAILTLWHILVFAGCKFCGMGEVLLLWRVQEFSYKNIVPLVC